MKNSFAQLYESHKDKIMSIHRQCASNGGRIFGPYLIEPNDAYIKASKRLVIVGQETGHWDTLDYHLEPHGYSVESQLSCYRNFNVNGRSNRAIHPGAFWNVTRKIELGLGNESHSCAALNLNRFSENGRRPCPKNLSILAEIDWLMLEELSLLKPDIVVFFTGPRYDARLQSLLDPSWSDVGDLPPRQLTRITSPRLECEIFRTYHPTYLRRARLEEKVIRIIVGGLKR